MPPALVGSSFSWCFLISELRFSSGRVLPSAHAIEDPSLHLAQPWLLMSVWPRRDARSASSSLCTGAWCRLSHRSLHRKHWGLGAGFLFCSQDNPPVLPHIHPSIAPGVHQQWEGAPWAVPSCYGNLKYAAKQRAAFVLIFPLYCLLLYKRLQFKINRSDSQLMWYSGRPEFLLLWQWSSAHLFCR